MKLAVVLLLLVGCERHPSGGELGHERGDCRPGKSAGGRTRSSAEGAAEVEDKTCEPGLVCLSNLCVRPPPGDCKAVAEQLASTDLGNYATLDQRAPVVAKYQADCERAMVSKDEAKCLDAATDRWSAGQCVPRMFPDVASTTTADCAEIVNKTKATMAKQATYVNDPQMKAWFDKTMAVMQQSCEEDRWPDSLKKCMLGANDPTAAQTCNTQMPPALQKKMQDRMVTAMQQMQQNR